MIIYLIPFHLICHIICFIWVLVQFGGTDDMLPLMDEGKKDDWYSLHHYMTFRNLAIGNPRYCSPTSILMAELNLTVKVHPVVLFQIVDAFERRNADSQRVIGTLLGKWRTARWQSYCRKCVPVLGWPVANHVCFSCRHHRQGSRWGDQLFLRAPQRARWPGGGWAGLRAWGVWAESPRQPQWEYCWWVFHVKHKSAPSNF